MKTINGDSLTPILIFRRLQGKHKFLLESSAQHEGAGRFSFIGANPRKTYKGVGQEIQEVSYKTGKTYVHQGNFLFFLNASCHVFPIRRNFHFQVVPLDI